MVTKTTSEVIATTADVYFNGVSVGHTQGAITLNVSNTTFNVNVNDFGPNVPVNTYSLGVGASVEVPLAQYDVDVLTQALPLGVTVSGNSLYIGDTTGQSLLDQAATLIVAPKDGSPQFRAPAAYVTEDFSVPFQLDEQSIINVTFTCVPDPAAPTASGSVFRFEPNQYF